MHPRIKRGRVKKPFYGVLYGVDGAGKTNFGRTAPDAVFLGPERGTDHLDDVARFDPCETYEQFISDLLYLREQTEFKSAVVDSLTRLEPLIWNHICKLKNWDDIEEPGYGKGYNLALDYWEELRKHFEYLRDVKGMHVILIGHSYIKPYNDPMHLLPYDRNQLMLKDGAASLIRQSVDFVGFLTYETFVKQVNKGDRKVKAFDSGDDKRILLTSRRPSYDAKNRFGLPHEIEIPLEGAFDLVYGMMYPESEEEIKQRVQNLRAQIAEMIPLVHNPERRKLVEDAVAKLGETPSINDLQAYMKRLEQVIETQEKPKPTKEN